MCGDPPKPCGVPVGWARVGLLIHRGTADTFGLYQRYYPCYHGTTLETTADIVKQGQLMRVGDRLINPNTHTINQIPSNDNHFQPNQRLLLPTYDMGEFGPKFALRERTDATLDEVTADEMSQHGIAAELFDPNEYTFTSPSVEYAAKYSPTYATGEDPHVEVVVQLLQHPASMFVLPHTLREPVNDTLVPQDEMAWFTDVKGPGVIPVAIMVRMAKYETSISHA
jgi:hypothetical protein